MEIKLEKFTKFDFSDYFRLVNNEKVMEKITERAIELKEAEKNFKKLIENNSLEFNFGSFKILSKKTNDFLGLAKLKIEQNECQEAELGYMLLPEYWGKGIASIVSEKLIQIAKEQTSIKEIFAVIDPKNIPSRKILIKNGFYLKEFKYFDGLPGEVFALNLDNRSTSANSAHN